MITRAEIDKAKRWRKARGLTLDQLSELTGYSISSIYWFELGKTPPGSNGKSRPINEYAWQRFKLCCAASTMKQPFDWE